MREYPPIGTRYLSLPPRFAMAGGSTLKDARMAYETWGQLSSRRDNAILLLGGLSASAHAASNDADRSFGWWEGMLGPGRSIDTNEWHVICANPLGSCKGSTGPASCDPGTGSPYGMNFPELAIEDIADAIAFLVGKLGVTKLACVIGVSMGGMVALSLLSRHPTLSDNHISISSAASATPFAIALRSLQREMIRADPLWDNGSYDDEGYPRHGMVSARKLGLISYRSAREWQTRFGRKKCDRSGNSEPNSFKADFEIESYLDSKASSFPDTYDANSYLYLSRCIDRFDLGDRFVGNAEEALARIPLTGCLVLGVGTDILFPLEQQREIADGLSKGGAEVKFEALESDLGHDAFLVDVDIFGSPIAEFLSQLDVDAEKEATRAFEVNEAY